jgi:uncharacterized membrane protein YphA (DoxX/SURF4 family)
MQGRRRGFVALRLVITLLFVPAIFDKLTSDEYAQLFSTWGYPSWGPVVISWIEIMGLSALWIPALAGFASVALMVCLVGAAGTWLIYGPRATAAYPGTILVLLAWLAWLERAKARGDPERPEHLAN